ncbi:pseudouridylate synthase 1 homolog isoform X1 [Episyrphus balteatus]|uniref:pseudouridylate synthase 1 homolog isoform X1 n=2 Tax=Episyrphus balteatus TaxID=286459 RepID=UPI002484E7FC|nr:pseudouridylate synthase 1 homolog isoform X1 [Episyrphus balteatus]
MLKRAHLFVLSKADRLIRNNTSFSATMSDAIDAFNQKKEELKQQKLEHKARCIKKRQWVESKLTEEEIAAKRANFDPADRIKRKKCALLMGYCGADYYGMQRNPGMQTIEEDLFNAMLKHKWITEEGFNQAQQTQFQRAARTDKGVSAARQICSIKLPDDIDVGALNSDLPEVIRVFAVKRVTKGFNAKDKCNARTYTYTLPSVAFQDHSNELNMETYRISNEVLERVNSVLKLYEGTKNYHNFTSKKNFLDPSSKRFMMSFTSSEPFVSPQGIEFLTLKVKGQSFMLHQIRKMVGVAISVVRGNTTEATIARAFTEERLDLPMAPGLGLVLDQVHYDRYNDRYGEDGIHQPLTWDELEPEIEKFVEKYIYSNIYDTEFKEKSMIEWLETLKLHSYDVRDNKDEMNVSEAIVATTVQITQ